MDSQLLTLSKIFTERLFRIPDYQRGYAWNEKQLKDFWSDIGQIEDGHSHYTGVLTLENVPEEIHQRWEEDSWIIAAKKYEPFFIVDGQQRLTTAIILVQVILERISSEEKLNYTEKSDIQRKFIFDSKDGLISRSYIFGYEKDNPSYNYLKSEIFGERVSDRIEETVYTTNLARAKMFFASMTAPFSYKELEELYRKVTQSLLFNIFTISTDVDVCVAFETMNNRGKPLSSLELLKNRLIYLSLKFNEPDYEKNKLRKAINDCWKAIYHNLGRNKEKPLDDDRFLLAHYLIYFGKVNSEKGAAIYRHNRLGIRYLGYTDDLLEKIFITKNVSSDAPENSRITLKTIYDYVSSLQDSVENWYAIFNPMESSLPSESQTWLEKLTRIGMESYLPLILVVMQKVKSDKQRLGFFHALERYLFVAYLFAPYYRGQYGVILDPEAIDLAIELNCGSSTIEKVTKHISDRTEVVAGQENFKNLIAKFKSNGFYDWPHVRYFLYEYNLDLQNQSKTKRSKISWPDYIENRDDFISVEHIWPQQARHESWTSRFGHLTPKQRIAVRNSLGNLLPLSIPKNAALSNRPFVDKAFGDTASYVSYRYGSYAENEVAQNTQWAPSHILDRGIRLLDFMERRWNIKLGDKDDKIMILGMNGVRLLHTDNK